MRCRYCGQPITKALIGWLHVWPPTTLHIAKPRK